MKIKCESRRQNRRLTLAPNCRESGMATLLFIALLAIMMVLVTVEGRSLIRLHREVKLLEQQQIKRLNLRPTNVVSTVFHP